MSVFTSILSSYWGFLLRLTVYLYKRKRLNYFQDCIELQLGNQQIENYGFKHIKRRMPLNNYLQSLKLSGTKSEYYYCNEKRLNRIKGMLKVLPERRDEFL